MRNMEKKKRLLKNKQARFLQNKKGAIELSIGTIVIIVLAMSMLILGIVLVRTIFFSATDSVKNIDSKVKNEINKLFTEDDNRRLVVYPSTGLIKIKQGTDGEGFAFSIRNKGVESRMFTYNVRVNDPNIRTKCGGLNEIDAEKWIAAGQSGSIDLGPGQMNDYNPVHVRFTIPDNAPPCLIRYTVTIKDGAEIYQSGDMDLKVL